ncbi:hypothetical protein [Kribbella sp. NPDC004875]|uniref:hypothetical protein n=1 Tax=Kribbella sp. NPDC004875 TaxID=3364107 RepID=UPI0036C3920C
MTFAAVQALWADPQPLYVNETTTSVAPAVVAGIHPVESGFDVRQDQPRRNSKKVLYLAQRRSRTTARLLRPGRPADGAQLFPAEGSLLE